MMMKTTTMKKTIVTGDKGRKTQEATTRELHTASRTSEETTEEAEAATTTEVVTVGAITEATTTEIRATTDQSQAMIETEVPKPATITRRPKTRSVSST